MPTAIEEMLVTFFATVLESDARIYGVLKQQILSWWTLWNFGDRRLCPTPHALVEPEEDRGKTAA